MLSARVNPQSLEERQRQGHDKREDPPAYHAILYGQPGQKRPAEVALEVHEVLPRAGEGMPPVDTRRVGSGRIIASPVSPSPRLGQERRRVDCGRMLLLDCMLRPSKRGSDAVVGVPHTLYVGVWPKARGAPFSAILSGFLREPDKVGNLQGTLRSWFCRQQLPHLPSPLPLCAEGGREGTTGQPKPNAF